jgi:FkbM family methyltransferase
MMDLKKLIHSITLRLPQKIALRSGLRVSTFSTADNSLFWGIFSSREYLSLLPYLIRADVQVSQVIDCGAACGYFSMLVEHWCRSGQVNWQPHYIAVEPSQHNFKKLKENFNQPVFDHRATLLQGLVGKKNGEASFYESKQHPWSSSINNRKSIAASTVVRQYIDLSKYLHAAPCLLKIDIEGGEFDFFDEYADDLQSIVAIIVEWHLEMGEVAKSKAILEKAGFACAQVSTNADNRQVALYLRQPV